MSLCYSYWYHLYLWQHYCHCHTASRIKFWLSMLLKNQPRDWRSHCPFLLKPPIKILIQLIIILGSSNNASFWSWSMLYFYRIFCQSIISFSCIANFPRPYSFDKKAYYCLFMSTSYFQLLFNRHNFSFTFCTRYANIRTKWWIKRDVYNFTCKCQNNFWLSRRFGRWSIRLIDVRIKEVPL